MQIPLPRGARKVPGRMPRRGTARGMLRRGTARGEGSSRKDTSFGDKCISPGAGRAFPPRNCCHLGTKCLPGEGSSRKDTSFGDKSISLSAERAFPPGNRSQLGIKCPRGRVPPRKIPLLGTKVSHPASPLAANNAFAVFKKSKMRCREA